MPFVLEPDHIVEHLMSIDANGAVWTVEGGDNAQVTRRRANQHSWMSSSIFGRLDHSNLPDSTRKCSINIEPKCMPRKDQLVVWSPSAQFRDRFRPPGLGNTTRAFLVSEPVVVWKKLGSALLQKVGSISGVVTHALMKKPYTIVLRHAPVNLAYYRLQVFWRKLNEASDFQPLSTQLSLDGSAVGSERFIMLNSAESWEIIDAFEHYGLETKPKVAHDNEKEPINVNQLTEDKDFVDPDEHPHAHIEKLLPTHVSITTAKVGVVFVCVAVQRREIIEMSTQGILHTAATLSKSLIVRAPKFGIDRSMLALITVEQLTRPQVQTLRLWAAEYLQDIGAVSDVFHVEPHGPGAAAAIVKRPLTYKFPLPASMQEKSTSTNENFVPMTDNMQSVSLLYMAPDKSTGWQVLDVPLAVERNTFSFDTTLFGRFCLVQHTGERLYRLPRVSAFIISNYEMITGTFSVQLRLERSNWTLAVYVNNLPQRNVWFGSPSPAVSRPKSGRPTTSMLRNASGDQQHLSSSSQWIDLEVVENQLDAVNDEAKSLLSNDRMLLRKRSPLVTSSGEIQPALGSTPIPSSGLLLWEGDSLLVELLGDQVSFDCDTHRNYLLGSSDDQTLTAVEKNANRDQRVSPRPNRLFEARTGDETRRRSISPAPPVAPNGNVQFWKLLPPFSRFADLETLDYRAASVRLGDHSVMIQHPSPTPNDPDPNRCAGVLSGAAGAWPLAPSSRQMPNCDVTLTVRISRISAVDQSKQVLKTFEGPIAKVQFSDFFEPPPLPHVPVEVSLRRQTAAQQRVAADSRASSASSQRYRPTRPSTALKRSGVRTAVPSEMRHSNAFERSRDDLLSGRRRARQQIDEVPRPLSTVRRSAEERRAIMARLCAPIKFTPPQVIVREPKVLNRRSLINLSRMVQDGLVLGVALGINDSRITGIAFDALSNCHSLADVTYKILVNWKRDVIGQRRCSPADTIQQLCTGLRVIGRSEVAAHLELRFQEKLELDFANDLVQLM